ncbi:hypothetical protein Hanom_Chr10g00961501 [Helianthus anomalus]
MSRTGRSLIRSILTKEDLESFGAIYQIPERFSPSLPSPYDPAVCTPERIVPYTLAFSFCGVLATPCFYEGGAFELSCMPISGEPYVPLFCMFYILQSDGDWFTFAKWKDSVTLPCYSFMPTSTYPKEWKNWFIFISTSMIPESPPLRDLKATIEDSVHVLFANETMLWKRMYEHPTRAYSFPEGILAMGGLSPLYSVRPKAYFGKKCNLLFCFFTMPVDCASVCEMSLWSLLQADCKEISFVDCGVVNLEMGNVLEGILLMSGVPLLLGRWR